MSNDSHISNLTATMHNATGDKKGYPRWHDLHIESRGFSGPEVI